MAVSYAPMMPRGYFSQNSRNEFSEPCISLHCERVGWLSDHDCEADAKYAAQEREADIAAEAEEIAPSVEAAQAELPSHVIDFLHALDRGDFGAGHRFSDGTESAYVAALRSAVAPFERRA